MKSKRKILLIVILLSVANFTKAQTLLQKNEVMKTMELANSYLMKK